MFRQGGKLEVVVRALMGAQAGRSGLGVSALFERRAEVVPHP
jgi:hypothetical protein